MRYAWGLFLFGYKRYICKTSKIAYDLGRASYHLLARSAAMYLYVSSCYCMDMYVSPIAGMECYIFYALATYHQSMLHMIKTTCMTQGVRSGDQVARGM